MLKKTAKILVTGGAGYIGSHMVRLLLEKGFEPVVFDNLSTGHREFIPKGVTFVKGDLRHLEDIRKAFKKHKISAVIHFAALIVVSESVAEPLKYFDNNVTASINLFKAMQEAGVGNIVFSSSACVYGEPKKVPITEGQPYQVTNPYGATKVMVEEILKDLGKAGQLRFVAFRYFNVAGAHPSGEIGIKMDAPTHLIPNVMRVACGRKKELLIFGDDYPTRDGSCVRDYIHVMDLCEAHWLGLQALSRGRVNNEVVNLGSGRGFSVLETVAAARKITGHAVPIKIVKRRPGDCAVVVASFAKAKKLLGWSPVRKLEDILASAFAWERKQHSKSIKG